MITGIVARAIWFDCVAAQSSTTVLTPMRTDNRWSAGARWRVFGLSLCKKNVKTERSLDQNPPGGHPTNYGGIMKAPGKSAGQRAFRAGLPA
jgi:hypothetical protein